MPRRPATASPIRPLRDMTRHADAASALLKSLAHPARLLVMCRLVEGEATVSELQGLGELSMSALSQHLAVLREAGLVTTRREAQTIHYALANSPALDVMNALHAAYCSTRGRKRGP
jgi:DNA-binding transcriptional ArsR family regulator